MKNLRQIMLLILGITVGIVCAAIALENPGYKRYLNPGKPSTGAQQFQKPEYLHRESAGRK